MADHDRVSVDPRHSVFVQLQLVIQILCRLFGSVGGRNGGRGEQDLTKAIFMLLQILLQRLNELSNHCRRKHDTRGDLLWLLHAEQKINNEFVLTLQHNSARTEDASGNMSRNKSSHMAVTYFLTLRLIR